MRVAFGVDGVLRDLMTAYVPHVGKTLADVTSYEQAIAFAGSLGSFLKILDKQHCWVAAGAYSTMVEISRKLPRVVQGVRVLIVTAAGTFVGQQETLTWLRYNDVPFEELHLCSDKLAVAFDAIIEGNPATAIAAAKAGRAAFLVRRPWTTDVRRRTNLFLLPEDQEAWPIIQEVLAGRLSKP